MEDLEFNVGGKTIKIAFPGDEPKKEKLDLNHIIPQLTKSKGGLYPHEILMLNIVSRYKSNCNNNFEWYWENDLGVKNPQALIDKLIGQGFVDVEDTKTAISRLTIPEIKVFLKEYGCNLTGKKAELIDRLFAECDIPAIGSTITQRRYCLTDKGKEEVESEENEYVMYTFKKGNGISIFDMNIILYKNNPLDLSYKDIIWRKYVNQAEEELQNLEFGPYRNSMWSMSRFLRDENKYDESLYYICKAAMYDISGLYCKSLEDALENLEYMIKHEFPYSDVATRYGGGLYIYIAPGLVDYISSMQRDMEAKGVNFKEKVIKNLKEIKLAKEVFSTEEKIEIFFAELDEDYDKLEEIYSKLEKTMKDKYNKLMEETIKYFVEGEECDDDTKKFQIFKNGISLKRKLEEYEEDYDEESIKILAEKLLFTDVETAEEDIEKTIELLKSMMATEEEDYDEDYDEEYYEDEEYDDEEEYYDEEEYNNIEKVCELLTSFDKGRIIKYCKQLGIEIPEDEEIFWASVHKAICKLFLHEDSTIGTEQFNESFNWLTSRGYVPIEDEENDEI